jgi:hypothetical protein
MNMALKNTAAVALSGALLVAAASPSFAQRGRTAAAAGIGFAAGAMIGAAAANSGAYYGYGPAYSYGPGYSYGPFEAPGYEPAPAYPSYQYGNPYECRTDEGYGRTSSCDTR